MYTGAELDMREVRVVQTESDFNASTDERFSKDNGRTWTPYHPVGDYLERDGKREIIRRVNAIVPNPINGNIIRSVMERVFLYEHSKAYKHYWTTGVMDWRDHTYLEISYDDGKTFPEKHLMAYEDKRGLDYNHGYHGTNIEVTGDGTIYSSICAPLESVCRAYGLDAYEYALSPVITKAVVVVSLKNMGEGYALEMSEPIIIPDSKSSRGLLEPNIITLIDGTFMLECRGSNAMTEGWNTRMKPGTPSHRWMSYSTDGINFTDPAPMTYDTGETFFSPSSISKWLRHSVTDRLYWLGNITPVNPSGNRPRYPLCIGEYDENRRCLIKDSVMVVDDRLPGEGELVQHSNFSFYEDRETREMHIEYSRLGQNPAYRWQGDAVRISIEV
jgi:hypothetical protein